MILRCVGKERDAADVPTWNDRGRDGQEDLGHRQDHHHKKSQLLLTRMEVLAMMSLEIGAGAVEPAGGCVGQVVVVVVV